VLTHRSYLSVVSKFKHHSLQSKAHHDAKTNQIHIFNSNKIGKCKDNK